MDEPAALGRDLGIGLAGVAMAALPARATEGDYSRPFVASLDGQDHGYVELYRAAKDSIATIYECDPYDLGLHAAIADLELMSKGIAQFLLPHCVASVLNAEPQCRRIMFDPDHRNKTARRFCEAGGCVFLGEHDMSNRRMALYACPAPPTTCPSFARPERRAQTCAATHCPRTAAATPSATLTTMFASAVHVWRSSPRRCVSSIQVEKVV